MLVEFSSFGAIHIAAVSIYALVGCWFALTDVLRFGAKGAVAQIDEVPASAVEIMENV